jgi:glycosyltransferase involved in cell wall biosynthesis
MKISFYQHSIFNGGIERVNFELAAEMMRRGHEVEFLVNFSSIHLKAMSPPKGLVIIELKPKHFFSRFFVLHRHLRAAKPDLVISAGHFSNEIVCLVKLCLSTSLKLIVTEHTTLSVELQSLSRQSIRRWLLPLVTRATYFIPDAIVSVSNGVKYDVEALFKLHPNRVTTIYNPVNFPDIQSRALDPVEHRWLQKNGPAVVLGIGRLEVQKDFANLLLAMCELRKTKDAKLIVLGVGSQRPYLDSLVQQLGLQDQVDFVGFTSNPYIYLRRATVFALSSSWEGLPITLIEALGIGIPIVSTNCPSGPSEILQGGKWGRLVPVSDYKALAEALLLEIEHPHAQKPAEALSRFQVGTVVDQYLALAEGVPDFV